jgi:hypothetical protein
MENNLTRPFETLSARVRSIVHLFPWEQSFECSFSQIWGHFKHLKFELASAHFAAI